MCLSSCNLHPRSRDGPCCSLTTCPPTLPCPPVHSAEARAARDLDELIAAHEAYLQTSIRKSLLDQESQGLHGILYELFRDMHKFSLLVERFHEAAESADSIAQLRDGARVRVCPPWTPSPPLFAFASSVSPHGDHCTT